MRKPTLNRAFPIVAAALGRQFGVQVAVFGNQACTDGNVIVLPAYDGDAPDYKILAWGYLAHEAAHVRYTDFEVVQASASSPLRKALTNMLEDIRIERALAVPYPGTRLSIGRVVETLLAEREMASPCERDHPACVLHGYMLLRLRADVLGQRALAGEAAKAETALRAVFPADAVTRLHGLLSGVPSLDSTHACLMLADRILKMLQEEAAPPTPGDDPAGQDRPDQPAAASSEGEKGDGQGEPSQKGANTGQTGADPAHRNALKAVLSAGDGDLRPDLFEAVENRLNGVSIPCSGTFFPLVEDAAADQAVGEALRQRVSVESARLRAALQGIVQASRLERPWHRRQGRRIDGRRLHRLASGDSRVFEQRLPKKAPNTAIHLLVDRSRSMNNKASRGSGGDRRVDIALRAALALTFALDGIAGVNPGATAFPGSSNDRVTRLLTHGRPAKTRAGAFALSASGSTPLDRALWYAASAVLACREERKVILTLTDGEPNNAAAALEIIQRCEASGIELAGIGIGIDVGHLFKRSAFIQTVDELGRKLFDLSRAMLTAT